jgi:hypothetical protein
MCWTCKHGTTARLHVAQTPVPAVFRTACRCGTADQSELHNMLCRMHACLFACVGAVNIPLQATWYCGWFGTNPAGSNNATPADSSKQLHLNNTAVQHAGRHQCTYLNVLVGLVDLAGCTCLKACCTKPCAYGSNQNRCKQPQLHSELQNLNDIVCLFACVDAVTYQQAVPGCVGCMHKPCASSNNATTSS